jgi:putative phosphoesterase
VKIVIVSDIHANLAALEALPERDFDQLWCIGDLVDYGPRPYEVVQWVKRNATIAVRGNHDYAAGFSQDPQCSPPFKKLAAETLRYTQEVCPEEDLEFLRSLPVHIETAVNGTKFYLVHATPLDPLFGYCPEQSGRWKEEVTVTDADVLIVGHTHTPFIRTVGKTIIVNPGSLGQPKTGRTLACYATWQDGRISLREYAYPLKDTVQQIRSMPISAEDQNALITVLETGDLPAGDRPEVTPAAGIVFPIQM